MKVGESCKRLWEDSVRNSSSALQKHRVSSGSNSRERHLQISSSDPKRENQAPSGWPVIRIRDNDAWKWVGGSCGWKSSKNLGVVSGFPRPALFPTPPPAVGWTCDTGSRVPECGWNRWNSGFLVIAVVDGLREACLFPSLARGRMCGRRIVPVYS